MRNKELEKTLSLVGDKWKLIIINELLDGVKRFGEIAAAIPGISQKVLTAQLRELEADRIILRKVYAEVPPRVEYSLTETGKKLDGVIKSMSDFGKPFTEKDAAPEIIYGGKKK